MILRVASLLFVVGLVTQMQLRQPPVSAQEAHAPFNFKQLPSDDQISKWLKGVSPSYRETCDAIMQRTHVDKIQFKSVSFDPLEFGELGVFFVDRVVEIRISHKLTGAERVRTLAFEIANTYLNEEHRQIDAGAAAGFFSAREFAIAHEIYEFEAWRIYRQFLIDLEKELGEGNLPAGLFYGTAAKKVQDYKLPPLFEYLKHMEESRHINHYLDWFEKHYSRGPRHD